MPNTFAPNGFSQYSGNGSAPTYEQVTAAILSTNTTPIFNGDPVVQSVNSTGVGTGYVQQAYGPVTLTVGATAIATNANGVLTVTYTGYSTPTANLPTFASQTWAPPIGSTIVISGATGAGVNGAFTVTASSAAAGTVTVASPNLPVSQTSTASGTVTVYVPVAGIFAGCKYYSVSQKRFIPNPYWIGSDTNADGEAYVVVDPNARFSVCTGNSNAAMTTPVALNQVGQNISFTWNDSATAGETNGNTFTGFSTMFADQFSLISANSLPASNAFLPFRIIGLQNYVAGQTSPLASINGNDSAAAYNRIIVGFNNAMPRNFAGI